MGTGKSTLLGAFIHQFGMVDSQAMHRARWDSQKMNHKQHHLAFLVDKLESERITGHTCDITSIEFKFKNKTVRIIDTPGNRDYYKNMISGLYNSDACIILVDPQNIIDRDIQEYVFLAKINKLGSIIVAITRMDEIGWNREVYENSVERICGCLYNLGIKKESLFFLPISGLEERSIEFKPEWFEKESLMEFIEKMKVSKYEYNCPLRIGIEDCYKLVHGSILGHIVSGTLTSGQLQVNDKILINPGHIKAKVKQIEKQGTKVNKALAGDDVEISLQDIDGEFNKISRGSILSLFDFPTFPTRKFLCKGYTFLLSYPLTRNRQVFIHTFSSTSFGRVSKLIDTSRPNFEGKRENILSPKCVTKLSPCTIQVTTDSSICAESFKFMSRIVLSDRGETIFVGNIVNILGI